MANDLPQRGQNPLDGARTRHSLAGTPADRILFGTLPGWPKATIGSLKRALIAWK